MVDRSDIVGEFLNLSRTFRREVRDGVVEVVYRIFNKHNKKTFHKVVEHIFASRSFLPENPVLTLQVALWEIRNMRSVTDVVHKLNMAIKKKNLDNDILIEDIIQHIAGGIERLEQVPPHLLQDLVEKYIIEKTEEGKYAMSDYGLEKNLRLIRELIQRNIEQMEESKHYHQETKDKFYALSAEYLELVAQFEKRFKI
jgi:hypothetical protein